MNNNNQNFPSLQPFEGYLPTSFDNSLTYLEKMNKMIKDFHMLSKKVEELTNVFDNVNSIFETKTNITKERKLSPSGNFTGLLNGNPINELVSKISNNESTINYLVNQFSDGYTGLVIDAGFFEDTNIERNYDGGVFK